MTDFNLAVGEKIWNDVTKMNGEITSVNESDITINWQDGNDIVEEVMTLDELSKATLKNYITKAADVGAGHAMNLGRIKANQDEVDRFTNRNGMRNTGKNDYKSRDAIRNSVGASDKDEEDSRRRAVNKITGIQRAGKKLAEDAEFSIGDRFELEDELFEIISIDGDNVELKNGDDELFELSKKTLGSYVKKAAYSLNSLGKDEKRTEADIDSIPSGMRFSRATSDHLYNARSAASKDLDKIRTKTYTRKDGINRATKRLTKEERDMNEDSMALQTVKPNSKPVDDPLSIPSKLDMMKKVLTMLGNVEYNGDQIEFLNKALDYIGKEAHMIGDGSAEKNKSSVAAHNPSLKEDVEKLFEGQEVSDEFKARTSNLFEAAVAVRVSLHEAELQEAYNEALNEEIAELEEIMATELSTIEENVSNYMNYVSEKWLEENQVAVESTLRNELTEEFIEGLKNLFAEHYIDVPEDRLDVLGQLEEDNKELVEAVNSLLQEKADLENIIAEATAESAFDEVTEGMKVTDAEKLRTLAEHVEFDGNIDSYKDKIKFIKESHFSKARTPKVNFNDSFITEEVQYTSPLIQAAVRHLNSK